MRALGRQAAAVRHLLSCFSLAPYTSMIVVHTRDQTVSQRQEAERLAETCAGTECMSVSAGPSRRPKPTAPFYLGRGAVAQLGSVIQEADPDRVFVNHMLSGVQQRNLERAWGRPVVDRVGLIIDIFAQRARTREAQLQVELASLDYKASRLVRSLDAASGRRGGFGEGGLTEVVSARERGRSGGSSGGLGGGGGAGETELQLQRRRLRSRIKVLKRQLEDVRRTRATQRAGRQRTNRPLCSIVGYTNAGKSSLISVLSGSYVEAEDRLFQTLDPTLRQAELPSGQHVILSDTVGFIDALPPTLIKAFQATLEEVAEADVLIHVMDGSSPQMLQQRQAVMHILRQLGISEERLQEQLIEVVNKADLMTPSADLENPAGLEQVEAPLGGPLLLDRSHSDEGPDEEQESDRALLQIAADAADDKHSAPVGQRRETSREGENTHESFPHLAGEGGAVDREQIYDVHPRDINANLEWLQQQRRRAGASAVLTSTVTGQGLHELMVEVDSMLERRQGCLGTDSSRAAEEISTSKGHLQTTALDQEQRNGSMASRAA